METKFEVSPWVAVNNFMDDEYRFLVIKQAITHLPKASLELRSAARKYFSETVDVKGFRKFSENIHLNLATSSLLPKFFSDSTTAYLVIALWAEYNRNIITDLKIRIKKFGLVMRS